MNHTLSDEAVDHIFRNARTHGSWLDKPVTDDHLRQIYALMKWGPTSANSCPARFLFLRTPEAKNRLLPALTAGNVEKTMTAPVTAIVAYDLRFYEKMDKIVATQPGNAGALCELAGPCGIDGISQRQPAGRLLHYCRPLAGTGLWANVRIG